MTRSIQGYKLPFRPDLQGLRALAVILVIVHHAGWTLFPGGFVGVDVFFVLSGYLISGLLLTELDATGRIAFAGFYARRLRRLLPALALMLVGTGLAAWLLLSPTETRVQMAIAPYAVIWSSNLVYAFASHGYFEELAARDLLVHTWSLGVEEQFYLLWPFLLWGIFMRRNGSWLRIGLALTFAVSLGVSLALSLKQSPFAFYMMPSRIWEFALGALVLLLSREDAKGTKAWLARLGNTGTAFLRGLGIALILGSALVFHQFADYPGYWALLPALGAALVILAGQGGTSCSSVILGNPVMVTLGNLSYSWYLWHWPVLVLGFSMGLQGQLAPTIGLVLFSLLVAAMSYFFVELPFWKGRFRNAEPRRVLLLGILLMVALAYGAFMGLRTLQHTSAGGISSQRGDFPPIYAMGCDAWHANADVKPCGFGEPSAAKTVVMIGDSIGLQWFSAVQGAFPAPEWRLIVLTKSACPIVDESIYYERIGQVYKVCDAWRREVLTSLSRFRPDVVVIGSSSTYAFTEEQWIEGSARVMAALRGVAGKVFVIPGTPALPFDGPGCAERNQFANGRVNEAACLAEDRMRYVSPVTGHLQQAARRYENVHVLDFNDLVCPAGLCGSVDKHGQLIFRDSQHLTNSWVLSQQPEIGSRFNALMGDWRQK
jgi:peptidoglycan/LPS O-acetylase OafA/YrhL